MSDVTPTRKQLEESISALEAQREVLGDAIEPALAALRVQLESLERSSATEDQRKQVTILFADVKGFTAMSGEMDPEDVADIMNSLWARLDQVIEDHGGKVDKHIGDAVMALFGAPVAREDDPERAVLAALAMQETIREFVDAHGPEVSALQMRVGINTGLAMLGKVGSTNEYTAIGHTVNVASRLEGQAEPGGILISQPTMSQVVGLFNVEATPPLTVKGVDEPVQAYHVKSAKPRTFRVGPREVAGIQTRMVGRDEEFSLLTSLLPADPDATPGPLKLVAIMGDPGVGKSRLVYEFFSHLEGKPHPTWLFRGRAVDSSRSNPYSVLRSILFDRFLIADSDDPATAKRKLSSGLAEFVGEDQAAKSAPVLGFLVGLDYGNDPALSGLLSEPRVIRDKGFRALANLVTVGRPANSYVVFLIEDIHWSDEESLDMLEYLAEQMEAIPGLILCTARPGLLQFRPEWEEAGEARFLMRLDALDDKATEELIGDVLQRLESAPRALRDMIRARSEGNPFFLEELVKMLIDEGVIEVGGEEWAFHVERLNSTTIPGTLTGVLQARLDSLPRSERSALQRSSVVGRVFWEDATDQLARAMAQDDDYERLSALAPSLKQRELAYERDPSAFGFTREYIFKHAMLHDVAYESVVRRARRAYHHEVAGWLTSAAGDRAIEFAGQIAEHHDRAGDNKEALQWLVRAGERARQAHAPEVAERAYRRALEISATLGDESSSLRNEAFQGLADVLVMQAEYEKAIGVYAELKSEAEEVGDTLAVARADHGIATAETYRGRPRESLESAIRSREAASRVGDARQVAKALFIEAWSRIRLGDFEEAIRVANEMLEMAREIGEKPQLAEALNLQGVIAASSGDYDEASINFAEAATIYEQAGNEERVMPILNNLGVIAELRGDYDKARDRYMEALEKAKESSDTDAELVYSSNLGGSLLMLGEVAEAEEILRGVVELAPGEFSLLSETRRLLGETLMAQGRFEEARLELGSSLDIALATGAHDHVAGAWRAWGEFASVTGGPALVRVDGEEASFEAADLFARSLEVAESVESAADQAKALAAWATHDIRIGNDESAVRRWAEAKKTLEELGADQEILRLESVFDSLRMGRL
ncbi:MAG: hypothetical protein DWQ40_02055 [Actinobacteria bacterium]|nr:MAG: hypothetical protein DWQ40_02055 [Actinomycetota bacterium]